MNPKLSIAILAQLDTRLSRLDKTIAPLGLQPLTRKGQSKLQLPRSKAPTKLNEDIDTLIQLLSPTQPTTSVRQPIPARVPSSRSARHPAVPGYSLEPAGTLTPIAASLPASGTATPADESAILARGPDIMALSEYFAAFESVSGDLERMWKGFREGRGGAREAGIRDLVSHQAHTKCVRSLKFSHNLWKWDTPE